MGNSIYWYAHSFLYIHLKINILNCVYFRAYSSRANAQETDKRFRFNHLLGPVQRTGENSYISSIGSVL